MIRPEKRIRTKCCTEGLYPVYLIVKTKPISATINSVKVEIIADAV